MPEKRTRKGGAGEKVEVGMRKAERGKGQIPDARFRIPGVEKSGDGEVEKVELGPAVVLNERNFRLRHGCAETRWRGKHAKWEITIELIAHC